MLEHERSELWEAVLKPHPKDRTLEVCWATACVFLVGFCFYIAS